MGTTDRENVEQLLCQYRSLLAEVDRWFGRVTAEAGNAVNCRRGCSQCCRGLFDITMPDALLLREGFERLPKRLQQEARGRAETTISRISRIWPEFTPPFVINHRSDDEWLEIMPEDDETPCALLDSNGCCMLYDYRPMTCRLHGITLIDLDGEVMDETCCSLNVVGDDFFRAPGFRGDFKEIFGAEATLIRKVNRNLLHQRLKELDTVIPAVMLCDFAKFEWRTWVGTDIIPVDRC